MRAACFAIVVSLFSLSAFASSYVLSAPKWGKQQNDAVTNAGGTVEFSHAASGLGVATSDDPGFLVRVLASSAITSGGEDVMVQWQTPLKTVDISEASVNPSNDIFYPLQWSLQAVEAPGAWAAGYTGAGVRVAVVDGGLSANHADLAGNVDVAHSRSFVPGFLFNQDVGTFWHATHVAGIIAARDNSTGVVGIAPGATIIGVKVLHSGGGTFGAVIRGIVYSSDSIADGGAGADIINMSLGAVFPKSMGNGPLVGALSKAVAYAGSKGVLVISAAGNNGLDLGQSGNLISVPADSSNGLAISATGPVAWAYGATNLRRITSYTNYGEGTISLAAPGGDFVYPGNETCSVHVTPTAFVTAPCWVFDMVLSTSRGTSAAGSYSWAAGTSMASPAAAAVAALIKQKYPDISLGALKNRLANSADDEGPNGHDQFYGRGFVNARRAVTE